MKNISNQKERILHFLDYKGISKSKFYRETGISNGVLDKKSGLSMETIEKFYSRYPEINPEWLLTGQGDMIEGIAYKNVVAEPSAVYSGLHAIPLIPIEAMAGFGTSMSTILELDCERFVVPTFKGADFLIQVKGSSMQPQYASGDIVACKKLTLRDMFFQWGKVYVLDTEQGPLLKRLNAGADQEHLMLVSNNVEEFPPFQIHLSKINAIAIVMGIIRLV